MRPTPAQEHGELEDTVAIWRAAMKDETHPRYKAAWVLFAPMPSIQAAARVLQDQSLDVIPWLYEILDTASLYEPTSLGAGLAPVRAVGLLGVWQVTEAVPRLLTIIEQHTWEEDLFDAAITALQAMGPEAFEPVLAFAKQAEHSKQVDLSAVVGVLGAGDDRAFRFIQGVFERERDDMLQSFVVGHLYEADWNRAHHYFERYTRGSKIGPQTRKAIHTLRPPQR